MNLRLSARKRQGEAAEARFLADATARGLIVSKPWGDNAPFDFVVSGAGLYRVQVKSVWVGPGRRHRSYRVTAGRGRSNKRAYRPSEVDLLAVLIAPEGVWYIIPIRALGGRKSVRVGSKHRQSRRLFEQYREAWSLLS